MQVSTAEEIQIGAARVATRNPVALWILTLITFGIWGIVWWYQVNRELRDYSRAVARPFDNSPVAATILVALWPLALIPGLLSVYVSSRRARTVSEWVETPGLSPILATLLFAVLFLHVIYIQRALNAAWAAAKAGRGPEPDYSVASGEAERIAQRARAEADRRMGLWR